MRIYKIIYDNHQYNNYVVAYSICEAVKKWSDYKVKSYINPKEFEKDINSIEVVSVDAIT